MYGGRPDTLCIEIRDKQTFFIDWTPPYFLRLFHKELQKNSTTLLSRDEFETYMEDNCNPLGTGMSLLAQDIERQIISETDNQAVCRRSARAAARFARASQTGPTVMRLATARAANCDEAKLRSEEESGRSGRSGQTAGRTHFFQTKKVNLLYV